MAPVRSGDAAHSAQRLAELGLAHADQAVMAEAQRSTVLTLNLPLTLILLQRANGHRHYPSKMRSIEGGPQHFQRDRLKLGILLQVVLFPVGPAWLQPSGRP